MPSSAALRQQIETAFQHRYPAVLTPAARTIREVAATGIAKVDELLNGGLPVGAISEISGPLSSGRTSIAMAFVAQRTKENVCAWIDARDSFDPESAAANGVSLARLLWVRCNDAVSQNTKVEGSSRYSAPLKSQLQKSQAQKSQIWTRLDQALRATDLLLQSGGFSAIVLDLGDESVEHGRRIPLATWFRFRQAADRTRCSVIVLGKASYAQSSAAVVLECAPGEIHSANGTVIRGFSFGARRRRERFSPITSIDRKPPVSSWTADARWNVERRA
jgi:recombination protein RecA